MFSENLGCEGTGASDECGPFYTMADCVLFYSAIRFSLYIERAAGSSENCIRNGHDPILHHEGRNAFLQLSKADIIESCILVKISFESLE